MSFVWTSDLFFFFFGSGTSLGTRTTALIPVASACKKEPKMSSSFGSVYSSCTSWIYFSIINKSITVPEIFAVTLQGISIPPGIKGNLM